MTQHDDIPRTDAALLDGVSDRFAAVEANRRTAETRLAEARYFKDDPIGSQVTEADLHVGERLERGVGGRHQLLIGRRISSVGQILCQRAPRDGPAVAVQQTGPPQVFQQNRRPAELVQVDHRLRAAGSEAAENRRPFQNGLQVSQIEGHARFLGQRQQMNHTIGRAADGGDRDGGVLERLPRQDVARAELLFEQGPDQSAGRLAVGRLAGVDGRDRTALGRHQPDGFHRNAPGVERGRDAAATRPRTGHPADLVGFGLRNRADAGVSLGVVDIEDRHRPPLVTARVNAAAAEQQAGDVHPGQGHRETGAVFIAVMQPDHRVVTVGRNNALGGVGDQVPRRQAGAPPFQTLRQIVADARRAEGKPQQSRIPATRGHLLRQAVSMHVAQVAFEQRYSNADLRLVEVVFRHTQAVKEGRDAALPPMRKLLTVPVEWLHEVCSPVRTDKRSP